MKRKKKMLLVPKGIDFSFGVFINDWHWSPKFKIPWNVKIHPDQIGHPAVAPAANNKLCSVMIYIFRFWIFQLSSYDIEPKELTLLVSKNEFVTAFEKKYGDASKYTYPKSWK